MQKQIITASLFALSAFGVTAMPAAAEPVVVKQVAPEYPRGAERRELEGDVSVSFEVQADGSVANATVVDATSPGVFDSAAIKSVEKWQYEPNNPGSVTVKIRFQL